MRADFPVVLDACVLAPFSLCDLLLRLAEHPRLYTPRWSEEILQEVHRTQTAKLGWPEPIADSWAEAVNEAFPDASVVGYEPLIGVCENDPKDRHVVAAALKSGSQMIVTANLRHFPEDALQPWSIEAVHPQDFLCTLYDMEPGLVVARLDDIATKRERTRDEVLEKLSASVPEFSAYVFDKLNC